MSKNTGSIKTYVDDVTGHEVSQLTSGDYNSYHLYFTDNSFTLGDDEIYFLSDRSSMVPNQYNFFKMDISTGHVEQVTHESEGIRSYTKSPDSEWIAYVTGNQLKTFHTISGNANVIYEVDDTRTIDHPFISHDKKFVGVPCNENVRIERGANYLGFKESMYAIKKSWIVIVDINGSSVREVFEDTHWVGHFQFAPDDSNVAMFCHEGPWNLVHQRIWLLDIGEGSVKPCFRQQEDDCVGHEFWTRDGYIFFDNRRKGHDGTITSDRTQATVAALHTDQRPYIGLANKSGEVEKIIDMPFYCNHYHANKENTLLVGDEVDNLVLIHLESPEATLETICHHATSWRYQRTHCHPTFSWNNEKILFTSDRDGHCNLYLFDMRQLKS